MSDEPGCKLYLITPPRIADPEAFAADLTALIEPEHVACVQLRLKDTDDHHIKRSVELLLPVCAQTDTSFILNDRPDLASELGCDGVHIGPEDMPYEEARRIMGDDPVIGVSCKSSRHQAMAAASDGADYVAFGAFFPTETKDVTESASPEIIEIWSQMTTVPCVAIGGITPENCEPIIASGADFIATCSAVWNHPDGPKTAIRLFSERLKN